MSNLNLTVYTSRESLSNRFVDYSNVYLLPPICWFGIFTSLPCIIVSFKSDQSTSKTFDYILINSIIDFVFLVTQSFVFIFRCGALCSFGYTYAVKIYYLYIYLFIGYILVVSQVLLNIYVAYDRLQMFSGKLANKVPISLYKVFAICTFISTLINTVPYVIAREVIPIGILKPEANSTYFEIVYASALRKQFQTPAMQAFLTVWQAIKNPVLFTTLCSMSILVCIRFRIYLKARKKLVPKGTTTMTEATSQMQTANSETKISTAASNDRKENNLTFLTIAYCIKILIGNFIDSFTVIANIFSLDIYVKYGFINITGTALFLGSHGVSLFLYYFFYNAFRRKFLDIFCCKGPR